MYFYNKIFDEMHYSSVEFHFWFLYERVNDFFGRLKVHK